MTRRERLERKQARREEWGAKRTAEASRLRSIGSSYRHDWAFITQPGHIPARAAMNRRDERAYEHTTMAQHHEQKADGLAHQLEKSVFSDDDNAIQALEARIAENEAKRDRMKLINKLYAKSDAVGLLALGLSIGKLTETLAKAGPYWGDKPHLPYELTNLGARIRTDRKRIEEIQRQQKNAEQAEASGGVSVRLEQQYAVLTFAEKPERAVLDSLRGAGYRWGAGSWVGERVRMPAPVVELLALAAGWPEPTAAAYAEESKLSTRETFP